MTAPVRRAHSDSCGEGFWLRSSWLFIVAVTQILDPSHGRKPWPRALTRIVCSVLRPVPGLQSSEDQSGMREKT
jgi:hypothetical protein